MVTKLDRLARSLPDARAIAEELTVRHVKLSLGGSVYDPTDPVGRLLFNVLVMVAEFEADPISIRTREGLKSREPRAGCGASNPSSLWDGPTHPPEQSSREGSRPAQPSSAGRSRLLRRNVTRTAQAQGPVPFLKG